MHPLRRLMAEIESAELNLTPRKRQKRLLAKEPFGPLGASNRLKSPREFPGHSPFSGTDCTKSGMVAKLSSNVLYPPTSPLSHAEREHVHPCAPLFFFIPTPSLKSLLHLFRCDFRVVGVCRISSPESRIRSLCWFVAAPKH